MKKINIYIPETTLAALRDSSVVTGVPVAEIIRRAVDAALGHKSDAAQLTPRLQSKRRRRE